MDCVSSILWGRIASAAAIALACREKKMLPEDSAKINLVFDIY